MHRPAFTLGQILPLRVPPKVVYERALNRWQRVMPLEMLWFTNVFRWNCKIDNRGHLQRFIQECGNHTQEGFKFRTTNEFHLKHTCLRILYYNKIEQGSKTLQLSNLKQHDMTRYKQLLGTKTCSQANYSKHLKDNSIGSASFIFLLSATYAHRSTTVRRRSWGGSTTVVLPGSSDPDRTNPAAPPVCLYWGQWL
jgi:hypothetical protein